MIRLSQMKQKEIILIHSGRRLGFIHDVEIDVQTGKVKQLFIQRHGDKGSFFQRIEEDSIVWEQIITVGLDIILVSENDISQKKITD